MFEGWENFYSITGTAASTLIGLLFVVVTLTERRERSGMLRAVSVFLTPTALHFAIVLSVSAVIVAPRLTQSARAALVGFGAAVGLGNGIWACVGMRLGTVSAPHWSDFWLYGATPVAIYLGLAGVSAGLWAGTNGSAHALAALLLTLLLLGIRNAWDLVTWMAPRGEEDAERRGADAR